MNMSTKVYRFQPINLGRWVVWSAFALVLLIAPLFFTSNLATTVLIQMGIAIIACLSYNMLLGQGGMLSFGHAVYSGLGGFAAIHALNMVNEGRLNLPVSLIPVVGGVGGLIVAAILGSVTTKKSGTIFAMITMGVGELVFSMSLMLPEFFGGEGGISANRVVGDPVLGVTFGPQIQLYYRARQPRARSVHWLRHATHPLLRFHDRWFFCRHRGRSVGLECGASHGRGGGGPCLWRHAVVHVPWWGRVLLWSHHWRRADGGGASAAV